MFHDYYKIFYSNLTPTLSKIEILNDAKFAKGLLLVKSRNSRP